MHLPPLPIPQNSHTAKGHNNSTQVSTHLDRLYLSPSNQTQNSKKYSECLASSTDQEEGETVTGVWSEEIEIYGEKMLVDYHCLESIRSFLSRIEARDDLKLLTKESLKLLILQRASGHKRELLPMLQQSYERYEEIALKSIFN